MTKTKTKWVPLRSKFACYAAVGGIGTVFACAEPVTAEEQPYATALEQIDRDIDRLEELEIFEVGDLSYLRSDNTGVPYTVPNDAKAQLLAWFVDLSEHAVASVDTAHISDDWNQDDGSANLCVRSDSGFCLTRELHSDNLERINQLQAIPVDDIVRSNADSTGFCYSSWEDVTEEECLRALTMDAVVKMANESE